MIEKRVSSPRYFMKKCDSENLFARFNYKKNFTLNVE